MKVTITDIAKLANVSKATVSAVLNDNPLTSKTTRNKVLKIIKKLDYKPNELARSLSTKKTKSIGIVVKGIDNPYFTKVLKGVYDIANDEGYSVLLGSSEFDFTNELQSIKVLKAKHVDGLIIAPLQTEGADYTYLFELIHEKYPFVLLDGVENIHTNVVDFDNQKAAYEAVTYLIKLGHKKIAYFAGPIYSTHGRERLAGYQKALEEHGITIRDDLIIDTGSKINDGYKSGKRLFTRESINPTAVFCYNDMVAIGLAGALRDLGVSVPEQVSIFGFDDIEMDTYLNAPLSTVHVSIYELGRAAARLLIKQMKSKNKVLNEVITLDAHLQIRATTSENSVVTGKQDIH